MLVPQGAGAESAKTPEGRKEDDLVQKAFSVLTQKEGLVEQAEEPEVLLIHFQSQTDKHP